MLTTDERARPNFDPALLHRALQARSTDAVLDLLVAALENQEKTIRLVRNLESHL